MEDKDLMVMDENEKFIADLTTRRTSFCSLNAVSFEEKAKLFKAMNNPEHRLSEYINKTILAKDLFCEVVDCVNQETGVITSCPRIVIIDKNGEGYQAVSLGVYGAVKKLIQTFGPPTWEEGLPLEVKQITKGQKQLLTFNVVTK